MADEATDIGILALFLLQVDTELEVGFPQRNAGGQEPPDVVIIAYTN